MDNSDQRLSSMTYMRGVTVKHADIAASEGSCLSYTTTTIFMMCNCEISMRALRIC